MLLTTKECETMELSHENLKKNTKTFRAFTGFDVGEFQILLHAFTIAWERYVQQHRLPLAVKLIDEMGTSKLAPNAYAVDSSLFTQQVIGRINQSEKPWLVDSEKDRIVYYKGEEYNCETFCQTIPKASFQKVTVKVRHHEYTRWIFSCTVRIRHYGKVRIVIIYDNPDKQGEPIYAFSNMLVWNTHKILSVRLHRWDIESFHEQIKQFLGAEDSQLRTEEGVRTRN
jgi:hypothetical protein